MSTYTELLCILHKYGAVTKNGLLRGIARAEAELTKRGGERAASELEKVRQAKDVIERLPDDDELSRSHDGGDTGQP